MASPSMSKHILYFFRTCIWHHFLNFQTYWMSIVSLILKHFCWFRHLAWERKIVLKIDFFTVGVKVEVVVGGGFRFYGTEECTVSCTPALGLGKTTWALLYHKLVLSGWCMATVQQKSRCDTYETWSCISQFSKANSLCVTHKCRVMEDFSWRVVWSLTFLGRTSDVLQTHHLEWSVMDGCWVICLWTLSCEVRSNGFCRCDCVK